MGVVHYYSSEGSYGEGVHKNRVFTQREQAQYVNKVLLITNIRERRHVFSVC